MDKIIDHLNKEIIIDDPMECIKTPIEIRGLYAFIYHKKNNVLNNEINLHNSYQSSIFDLTNQVDL